MKRLFRILFSILFLFFAITPTALGESEYASVLQNANWGWKKLNGVEYGKASFDDLYGNAQVVSIARYSQTEMSTMLFVKEGSKQGTDGLAEEAGATAAINGSYFNMSTSTSTTALWIDGKEIATTSPEEFARCNGIVGFKDGVLSLEPYGSATTASQLAAWGKKYDAFVVAGPILRRNGVSLDPYIGGEGFYGPHPRTLLGKCADGTVYMVVAEGRMDGAAGFSLPNLLTLAEDFGMTDAINLDGGGSSALWMNGVGVINRPSGGAVRVVPNIVIATSRLFSYDDLQNVIKEYSPKLPTDDAIGTDPGCYSISSAKAMSDALAQAQALDENATQEQLSNAIKGIKNAYDSLYCYPLHEGYYYIENVCYPGILMQGDADKASKEGLQAVNIAEVETLPYFKLTRRNGHWVMQCADNGMYVGTVIGSNGNGRAISLTADAQYEQVITWVAGGRFKIQGTATYPYSYTGSRVRVYSYPAGGPLEVRQMWHLHPAPTGMFDLDYNLENDRVRGFIHDFEYTESDASKVNTYNVSPPARRDWPLPVSVYWTQDADADAQQITWSESPDYADAVTQSVPIESASYQIYNLIPGRKYYCKVEAIHNERLRINNEFSFETDGQNRQIRVDGTANVRDLGGWPTACGRPIKYGKIFRGAECNGGHNLEPEGFEALRRVGIRAELDLRSDSEADNITKSVLGNDVSYRRTPLAQTASHKTGLKNSRGTYKAAVQYVMTNVKNDKPIYFHCAIGRDRTGTLAVLLEGVLGMSKSDIYKDYELTNFSPLNTPCNKSQLDEVFEMIEEMDGETLEQKFRNFFYSYFGIGNKAIDTFREKMLGTEEEADAIGSINRLTPDPSLLRRGEIYDLSGRKFNVQCSTPKGSRANSENKVAMFNGQKKGVYIVNGQKIY